MNAAIELTGVGKAYRLGSQAGSRLRSLLGWQEAAPDLHWALQDVDLRIGQGETFGIIGENGAGKSTLLKLIAGTSRPTHGQVSVSGRVAALLELGAGFHPDESGRDNVFLMGALAGVSPRRMAEHYQAIADFSELSAAVLARPVKTYSSGMFMRLAFATATAVDPDVLVVDEALSVGDMHFQKKSLDRILGFREQGRTVLFCSHNLYQVRSLCQRAAWLQHGRIRACGPTEVVVTAYESFERAREAALREGRDVGAPQPVGEGSGLAPVRLRRIDLLDGDGASCRLFQTHRPMRVQIDVEASAGVHFHIGAAIVRNDRENVFGSSTHFLPGRPPFRGQGEQSVFWDFPALALLSGEYRLSVYALDDSGLQVYDLAETTCPFTVHNPGAEFGIVAMPNNWS